jgi:hypothetical protein
VKQTWDENKQAFQYDQTVPQSFREFKSALKANGWEQFHGDVHPDHLGADDFKKQYNGEWYHLSVIRPVVFNRVFREAQAEVSVDSTRPPAGFSIHWEEAEPGSLKHLGNKIHSVLTGTEIRHYRGIPQCK